MAIPVGIISATRQYSTLDNTVTVGSFLGLAIPNFWLALLLQLWLASTGLAADDQHRSGDGPTGERWRTS